MSYTSGIYWLTRLDSLASLFTGLFIFGVILFVFYHVTMGIFCAMDSDEMAAFNKRHKWTKYWVLIILIVGGLGHTFTPTTKEAVFIVAGGKTLEYASKDTSLQKIPGQMTAITSTWLEQKLTELEGSVKKQVGIDSTKK